MNESAFWSSWVKPRLAHAERIESRVSCGIPDVSYIAHNGLAGWLELKYVSRVPSRGGMLLSAKDFRQDQILWLSRWVRHGGLAGMLVGVGDIALYFRAAPRPDWYQNSWGFQEAADNSTRMWKFSDQGGWAHFTQLIGGEG